MKVYTYAADGSREPFDPAAEAARLPGCILCGGSIILVGIFVPNTDVMRAVVLKLRQHALPPQRSTAGVAYGLCAGCVNTGDVTDRVESALAAAAERVVLQ